eukprot:CAMPEP_0177792252 /NCGR_PEP_ID=MMETSP0491_2-20121128/24427_1 /TAXON_ID=63592 /ORGANISM="Tetraselmis chuii, Strain PLY429" /LENGTH=61 /DNA_ID=CAMNT_0019314657 /DNA_START=53 /DNA_END=237 /DNA_ORIENTATION=+
MAGGLYAVVVYRALVDLGHIVQMVNRGSKRPEANDGELDVLDSKGDADDGEAEGNANAELC